LATVRDRTPLHALLSDLTRPSTQGGRRVRALDLTGKDRELFLALTDPQYAVCGVTHRRLQVVLGQAVWGSGRTPTQLSARISRHLRLLRAHGLLRKQPNQRRYFLTAKGRSVTTALAAALVLLTVSSVTYSHDRPRPSSSSSIYGQNEFEDEDDDEDEQVFVTVFAATST
jgi:hypothetical protein